MFEARKAAKKIKDAQLCTYVMGLLHSLAPSIKAAKDAGKNVMEVVLTPDEKKNVMGLAPEYLDVIKKHNLANIESTNKNAKEIFFNFFGMNENWPLGRNILGALMVHCPEWPTYFIPAYTQAKSSGDAHELKKGEGARGLITGGLEGIAVGALVSGRMLKPKEMGPYIVLGAALQLFSSKLFPWLGEKLGKIQYDKLHPKPARGKVEKSLVPVTIPTNFAAKPMQNPIAKSPAFKGKSLYNSNSSNRMKI